jgi:hypothetical protein
MNQAIHSQDRLAPPAPATDHVEPFGLLDHLLLRQV